MDSKNPHILNFGQEIFRAIFHLINFVKVLFNEVPKLLTGICRWMLSVQLMFGVSCNRLLELLRTKAKSDIVSEKIDAPYPEPEKTKHYTTVSLVLLTFVIVAGLLMFAKKPSIEPLLMVIVGVA